MDCYHIEHPDEDRTLCHVGWEAMCYLTKDEYTITLQDAACEWENIPEEQKCDICWRDDEWQLLLLAELP